MRAVILDQSTSTRGLAIPVIIEKLIDNVYISPYAPKWFEEVVHSVMEKYEILVPVVSSEMAKRPFY